MLVIGIMSRIGVVFDQPWLSLRTCQICHSAVEMQVRAAMWAMAKSQQAIFLPFEQQLFWFSMVGSLVALEVLFPSVQLRSGHESRHDGSPGEVGSGQAHVLVWGS